MFVAGIYINSDKEKIKIFNIIYFEYLLHYSNIYINIFESKAYSKLLNQNI